MSNKYSELAMVDIVEALLRDNKTPLAIQEIFSKIAEIKGFALDDIEILTNLYMNIVESGKFVFVGDDKWDLKEGNLELWGDDGSAFIDTIDNLEAEDEFAKFDAADFEDDEEELEEDEDDLDLEEDEFEDEEELDEETKKELEEEKEYIEVELPLHTSDDDDSDFEFDEDDYDDIMDDYEDMYED